MVAPTVPSRMAHAGMLSGLVTLTLAACGPAPVAVQADLGYRLVVENGMATVSGRVLAPKSLFATSAGLFEKAADGAMRLAEEPVAGATVQAIDANGQLNPKVASVLTDAAGRFTIRGLRLGEPAYLQAKFSGAEHAERSLYAYVKPEREQACQTVSLASTLLVHKMARSGHAAPAFSAEKLADVLAQIQGKLPDLLTDAADAEGGDLQQVLTNLVNQATTKPPAGGGVGGGGLPAGVGGLIDRVFDQDPAVKDGLNKALDTFLDVNFTVQAFGTNDAQVVRQDRIRQLLIGKVELLCQAGAAPYQKVAFWLNNEAVAEGQFDGQAWVGAFDTRTVADGPYVLSAVVTRKDAETPVMMRAFVYVRNLGPAREAACDGWDAVMPQEAK